MQARKIYEAAKEDPEYYADLVGIGSRVFPDLPPEISAFFAAQFVANYELMWHDVGNMDPIRQEEKYKGRQPLFLDGEHEQKNHNIPAQEYLKVFKDFTRRWAARKCEGDPQEDWYKAQDEFSRTAAVLMKNYLQHLI